MIAEGKKAQHELDYQAPDLVVKAVRETLESLPADKLKAVDEVLFNKFSS